MEMELNEVQWDLNALRKLYGLLLQEKPDFSDPNHTTANEILDSRARALLKDLLDGATERLLQKYRKLIAAPEPSDYNISSASGKDGGDGPSRLTMSSSKREAVKKQCQICSNQNSMEHQTRVEDLTKEMAGDRNFSNGGTVLENRNWSGLRATIKDKLVIKNHSSARHHLPSTIAASDSPPQFLVQAKGGRDFDHAGKLIDSHMSSSGSYSEFSHEGRASEPSGAPINAYTERPEFVKRSEASNFEECVFNEDDMQTHPVIKRAAEKPGSAVYPNRRILQKQTGQRTNRLLKRNIRPNREMCEAAMADSHRVRHLHPEASQNYHRTSQYVSGLRSPISTRSKYDMNSTPSVDDEETETTMKARPLRSQRFRTTQSKDLSRQPTLHHNPYTRGKKYQDDIESSEEESRDTSSSWTSSKTSSGSSDSGTYSSRSEKQASERMVDPVDSEYDDATESYSSRSEFSDPSSTKNDKPVHYRNKEKTTGRLKRLKNKLGLIFHHHHHHHHQADHHPKVGNSTWKYLQNIFHHKRKRDVHESQAVDKQMKKELARLPRKHQGHFSVLMKGFKRHLKHPKKSKNDRTKVTRLGSNRCRSSSKARKKLHWFGMLRGQRGVKLPNKGRLKFKLGSKKP